MFDSIVLNRSVDGPALTTGEIAEALIFYQNVHIVMETSTLLRLIGDIGLHNVIKLLSLPDVKTTFIEEFVGVYSESSDHGTEHALISAYASISNSVDEAKSWKKRLLKMITRQGFSVKESENFIERFKMCATLKKLGGDHFIKGGVISAAQNDLDDADYVSSAARIIVKDLLQTEELPDNLFYRIHSKQDRFQISTNIDFKKINQVNKDKLISMGETTPASIAAGILSASYGLILAAHYGGDFHTSTTNSNIIQYKNKQILNRTNANKDELNSFNEIILNGSPNISALINEKERSFEEFLELLSKAKKFKRWLKGKSPDSNLVSDYLDDITKTGWLGTSRGKVLRYISNTGVGLIEPVSGIMLSAIDAFIVDRFSSGWKPNQFITTKLKPFVDRYDNF